MRSDACGECGPRHACSLGEMLFRLGHGDRLSRHIGGPLPDEWRQIWRGQASAPPPVKGKPGRPARPPVAHRATVYPKNPIPVIPKRLEPDALAVLRRREAKIGAALSALRAKNRAAAGMKPLGRPKAVPLELRVRRPREPRMYQWIKRPTAIDLRDAFEAVLSRRSSQHEPGVSPQSPTVDNEGVPNNA